MCCVGDIVCANITPRILIESTRSIPGSRGGNNNNNNSNKQISIAPYASYRGAEEEILSFVILKHPRVVKGTHKGNNARPAGTACARRKLCVFSDSSQRANVACAGGPVLHRAAAHSATPAPRLQSLVRPHEADAQGHPQHAVRVVYEPDGGKFHHQHAPAETLLRLRAQLPRRRRPGNHLQQHLVATHGCKQLPRVYHFFHT